MNFSKWSIFRANLDPVIGSEQGKSRPVLIISEGREIYPNEVLLKENSYGLENESILLCHQIRSIDKKRLSKKYGFIQDDKTKNEIFDAIIFQFGIPIS